MIRYFCDKCGREIINDLHTIEIYGKTLMICQNCKEEIENREI